jgi:hypothetical protein
MRLSRTKSARFLVRFVVLSVAAGTLAGYSAHATRPGGALPEDAAADHAAGSVQPQISNRLAKADRLFRLVAAAPTSGHGTGYALASATPGADLGRRYDAVFAAARPFPSAQPQRATAASEPDAAPVIAATRLPPGKPKRLPAPPPNELLDDAQIAGIKGRLRLTEEQAQYWPAVEVALREVARTQLHVSRMQRTRGGKANIDVNSPEVQRLIFAAMPLLMRLREDQKSEVRKLARVIGLDRVASQI